MAAQKLKKCTLGPRHSWSFVKDVKFKSMSVGPSGTSVRLSVRGLYRCECGERKYGDSKGGL